MHPIYIKHIQYIGYEKKTPSHEMERSTHFLVWLMCTGNEIKNSSRPPLTPSGKKSYTIRKKHWLLKKFGTMFQQQFWQQLETTVDNQGQLPEQTRTAKNSFKDN